jgi:hypothetical protein
MADIPPVSHCRWVTHTVAPPPAPVDLAAARARRERAVRRAAAAPVLHLTPEFLEALQGSWGTPEELGLAPRRAALRVVGG